MRTARRLRGMLRSFAAAAGISLTLLSPVRAQVVDFEERVDAETLQAVQPVLDAAERDSLPVETLRSKVLEGVAKQRPAGQIARVVGELAEDLRAARALLLDALPGRALLDGEVVAVALAVRQGVAPEALRPLWASRPEDGSLEIPVTVLGELVRSGVPVADASTVMEHVVRTSVPLQVAAQLPGRVDGAIVSGAAPSAALTEALRTLGVSAPPGRGPN